MVAIILFHHGFGICSLENSERLPAQAPGDYPSPNTGCLAAGCHAGIEPIREHQSEMAQAIYEEGIEEGDPNGCVVCLSGFFCHLSDLLFVACKITQSVQEGLTYLQSHLNI